MANEVQVLNSSTGRVFVIFDDACTISREKILELLRDADVDPSAVVFLETENLELLSELDGMPVVFPVDQATCELPELERAARQCNQLGGHVILVFGEYFPYSGLHPIADKYGTQCGWSAVALKNHIAGEDGDNPRDAFGAPVRRPEAGQVKC
jgi:hypothetical protein